MITPELFAVLVAFLAIFTPTMLLIMATVATNGMIERAQKIFTEEHEHDQRGQQDQ